jgi:hydrogenase expression/formation protein HypE
MKHDTITLDHGSGGKMSHRLISEAVLPVFDNPALRCLDDGAVMEMAGGRIAFSTDTYVVDPIFFPGGSIGDLAVNGTVNDLAMCGAVPAALSAGLIIEEGFGRADLDRILRDMQAAARAAGVRIVTGDTKVVPRGAADKIFINTAGLGAVPRGADVSGANARAGDRILVSGTLADHGMAILTQREGLQFESPIQSDTAPLNHMAAAMIEAFGDRVHVLRDPTRGGLGTALNEIAASSGVGVRIHEDRLPIREAVAGICELLGFDPLYVANEGKLIAVVAPDAADGVLEVMRRDPFGRDACIIGEVVPPGPAPVIMSTAIGGTRIVDMLAGEQLPRIC